MFVMCYSVVSVCVCVCVCYVTGPPVVSNGPSLISIELHMEVQLPGAVDELKASVMFFHTDTVEDTVSGRQCMSE